jgi:drug/metabolite transporter (DMT)-like permease
VRGPAGAAGRATLAGLLAILLWSSLALLTVRTAPVPPLLLNALAFGVATLVGLGWGWASGTLGAIRRVPWTVHLFGVAGLCGYHLLYFSALRLAPPAQASLVAYLWPLLIVLLAGLTAGRLSPRHVAGALVAFAGAALVVLGREGTEAARPALGLLLAGAAAVTWALYSVGSSRLGAWPTIGVTVPCAGTALLSALAHLAWEDPAWPATAGGWGAVLLLGLGPVGAAFFLWDAGMKRGDVPFLGVAAYAAPLLSTLLLVLAGEAEATASLALAALLVVGGAALAARRPARREGARSEEARSEKVSAGSAARSPP